eukprot:TRINITY_DN2845_c0_g1_i1.p1 TRINITY_DN2845_c0_g1~~TRINITY_DN2845_c0_g1_i1.p1  ORF type:complete len:314 (+),score=78.51 TRINITY_DN2845_c0_g1_i1:98-1039(+)
MVTFNAISLCMLLAATSTLGLVTNPRNGDQYEARTESDHQECTAIYNVKLEGRHTTQGNDLGMTATHGKDTRISPSDPRYQNFASAGINGPIGRDWRNYPFPNSVEKQAAAARRQSVTALTEDTATPMGFVRSVMYEYHSVCVNVEGVYNRWVEIMAESLKPDQQICVMDWKRPNLAENPLQMACGNGELYACRESANEVIGAGNGFTYKDDMAVKFFCQDSCDDSEFEFYWRIVASQMKPAPGNNDIAMDARQPDGENWCATREGDDYPSSLLQPYPDNYDAPAIFERSESSASSVVASVFALVALMVARCC